MKLLREQKIIALIDLAGEGQIERVREKAAEFGNKVLMVYGGGTIKRTELYDRVINLLQEEAGVLKE